MTKAFFHHGLYALTLFAAVFSVLFAKSRRNWTWRSQMSVVVTQIGGKQYFCAYKTGTDHSAVVSRILYRFVSIFIFKFLIYVSRRYIVICQCAVRESHAW